MCGKVLQEPGLARIIETLEIDLVDAPRPVPDPGEIFPPRRVLVVGRGHRGATTNVLRWGLVPRWAKDTAIARHTVNARSETVHVKPCFRDAFRTRRCIVPVNAFYEWHGSRRGRRYRVNPVEDPLLCLAGVWDTWREGERVLHTFSILTTPAGETLRGIHPRQPSILRSGALERWLSPHTPLAEALALARRVHHGPLEALPG